MIRFRETTLEQLALDHKVEANALTGSARLAVSVPATAGRDGFGPDLALGYDSGTGGGPRARLLHRARKRSCDPGATVPLAVGEVGAVTLLRHVEQAVLPDDAVDAAFDGDVTAAMLGGEGHRTYEQPKGCSPLSRFRSCNLVDLTKLIVVLDNVLSDRRGCT